MKIDVRYIFGNTLRRNYKPLRKFCSYPLLSVSSTYAGVLGFVGVVKTRSISCAFQLTYVRFQLLSFYDIIRIIRCGSVLPCSLWRSRIKPGKLVSAECERDLKLVSLVLSLEYYLLLICGSLTVSTRPPRLALADVKLIVYFAEEPDIVHTLARPVQFRYLVRICNILLEDFYRGNKI